jgi:hypothetical protein
MRKFHNTTKRAALRKRTHLGPILRNDTRWSSAYEMVSRYTELSPFIDATDRDLVSFLLSPAENVQLSTLISHLEKLESVTKKLQSESIDMADVRMLFDAVIDRFPAFSHHLFFGYIAIVLLFIFRVEQLQ